MLTIYITTPEWNWFTSSVLGLGIMAIVLMTWGLSAVINWTLQRKYF